jgi:RNA polymerase sigma factor (sigma-70 family)
MEKDPRDWRNVSDENLALMCAVRPVDEEAWDIFYARHIDFVESVVRRRIIVPGQEIEDLCQTAMLRIFEVLPMYDPKRSRPRTFMARVIVNLAIDYLRRGKNARQLTDSIEDEITALQLRAVQDPRLLGAAAEYVLRRLRNKSSADLMLDLLHGKDVKIICQERNLAESQVYDARNWLREKLREVSAGFPEY